MVSYRANITPKNTLTQYEIFLPYPVLKRITYNLILFVERWYYGTTVYSTSDGTMYNYHSKHFTWIISFNFHFSVL